MPHLIIEYAQPLEKEISIQKLTETAFDGAVASELFTPANIKSRSHPVEAYWIGGAKQNFIHVNVKLLPGRTEEQKTMLSQKVFDAIKDFAGNVKTSVEVHDLPDAYTKG